MHVLCTAYHEKVTIATVTLIAKMNFYFQIVGFNAKLREDNVTCWFMGQSGKDEEPTPYASYLHSD